MVVKGLLGRGGKDKAVDYEDAKALARDKDAKVREALAARQDIKPEILYFLAEDPAPAVRRVLAINPATPRPADLILARDGDEDVRATLAQKIATLVPGLTPESRDKVNQITCEILEVLARDQATRVRRFLSEALKEVANAPPSVIRRLANDADLVVSTPVLRYSPVLTDEDLLDIIAHSAVPGVLRAISRRNGIRAPVVDAVVAADDEQAMALLLANPSAQIREVTLDRIVDRAADIESWHAPLAKRPGLPVNAARKIARFVARDLLQLLVDRKDLHPDAIAAVQSVVEKRIAEEETEGKVADDTEQDTQSGREGATRLHQEGKLGEAGLMQAMSSGDREFVVAGVALLAGLKPLVVEKAISTQSAKGVLSMAWKAGLSARFAEQLQLRVAKIRPKDALRPRGGESYPLSQKDMEWQIDFFRDLAKR